MEHKLKDTKSAAKPEMVPAIEPFNEETKFREKLAPLPTPTFQVS